VILGAYLPAMAASLYFTATDGAGHWMEQNLIQVTSREQALHWLEWGCACSGQGRGEWTESLAALYNTEPYKTERQTDIHSIPQFNSHPVQYSQ